MSYWKQGEKSKMAALAGISTSNLSEILHRRRGVSAKRAFILEAASRIVHEHPIPQIEWLNNRTSTHDAFYGKPHTIRKS